MSDRYIHRKPYTSPGYVDGPDGFSIHCYGAEKVTNHLNNMADKIEHLESENKSLCDALDHREEWVGRKLQQVELLEAENKRLTEAMLKFWSKKEK